MRSDACHVCVVRCSTCAWLVNAGRLSVHSTLLCRSRCVALLHRCIAACNMVYGALHSLCCRLSTQARLTLRSRSLCACLISATIGYQTMFSSSNFGGLSTAASRRSPLCSLMATRLVALKFCSLRAPALVVPELTSSNNNNMALRAPNHPTFRRSVLTVGAELGTY